MSDSRKRKPARPPPGKRGNFTVCVRDETRQKLIANAKANRVSVSEEIERRLEIMFANEDFAAHLFGGTKTLRFVMRVAGAISRAEHRLGRRWFTDFNSILETKAAVMQEMTGHVLTEQLGFDRPEGCENVR